MTYMNEHEINLAKQRHTDHPILSKAAIFLSEFRDQVNRHSDGWPYWSPPVKAAAKLMALLEGGTPPSESELQNALRPIKAFYTRHGYSAGMEMPRIEDLSRQHTLTFSFSTDVNG